MSVEQQVANNFLRLLKDNPEYQKLILNSRFKETIIHSIEIKEAQSILDNAIEWALNSNEITEEQAELISIKIKDAPTLKGMTDRIELLGRGTSINAMFGGNEQLFAAVTPPDSQMPESTSAFGGMKTMPKETQPGEVVSKKKPHTDSNKKIPKDARRKKQSTIDIKAKRRRQVKRYEEDKSDV